jgi:hypothetical protein
MFLPHIKENEPVPGTTALALAAGPACIAYAVWIGTRIGNRRLAHEGGRFHGFLQVAA